MTTCKPIFLLCVLLCALAFLASGARAEDRPQVAATARSVGLGGSFTGLANDATATLWNPSGIPTLQRQELVFSYADRYGLGLENSTVSYVFPLFERHALGFSWSRDGYSDSELDDNLQVLNLAYGFQPERFFSFGVAGKLVFQNIELSGTSLRNARGFGYDAGILLMPKSGPLRGLRFGLTLQDIGGTSVRDNETQTREEIFPQTLRGGVAYQARDDLTLSVDLDDRIHAGAMYRPVGPLVLRAGIQRDLSPPPGASSSLIYSLGFGIRWNTLLLDYAYEHHPVLPATHYVSLSFSYNPSLVTIKDAIIRPSPVFKSFYRTYEENDFIDVVLHNASQDPLPVTVSIDVPTLTETPNEDNLTLPPQSTQRYGFRLTFPENLLETQSAYYDNMVQPTVKVTYTRGHSTKTTTRHLGNLYVLGKDKISWSNPKRIGAFITSESRTVDAFARGILSRNLNVLEQNFPNNNMGKAALLFDALSAYGLRYQQDPTTPFVKIFNDNSVFDTVEYPYEFFRSKTGDCDDCTTIYCALLENLNIPTAVLDVDDPEHGHIYMMFDSGIPVSEAGDFFLNDKEYVLWKDRIWIPVEITLFGSPFSDAWRNGASEYYLRKKRGYIHQFLVSDAQKTFKPGVVPDAEIALPSQAAVDTLFDQDLSFFDNRLEQIATASGVSMNSPEGLYDAAATYLRLGRLDRAMDALNRAVALDSTMADAYNAKGVILTRRRQYDEAIRLFRKAVSLNPNDAGFRVNLSLVYFLQGRREDAEQAYQEAVHVDRSVAGMFGFLKQKNGGSPPSEATGGKPAQKLAAEKAYEEGAAHLRLNALDKALAAFDRALSLNPNNADAYNAKGVVLTRQHQYDQAVELYKKAIELAPDNAGFHFNLAIVYDLQGKEDDARVEYRRAVELDPGYGGQLTIPNR